MVNLLEFRYCYIYIYLSMVLVKFVYGFILKEKLVICYLILLDCY